MLIWSLPVFSSELSFYLTPFFGLEQSMTEEAYYYVRKSSSDSYKLKSLLEWEQKPVFLTGLEGGVLWNNTSFILKADYKFPLRCGVMRDSDYTEDGMKFNYSINKATLTVGTDLSGSVSHIFDFSFFKIEPELSANWSYLSIKARDGHGWYGEAGFSSDGKTHAWNDPEAHYFPDEKYHLSGVDYTNHTIALFTGVNISKTINKTWENSLGFYIAPFTYIYAKDAHVGKITYFTSEDMIFTYWNNFRISYKTGFLVNERFSIQFLTTWEWCLLNQGTNISDGYKNLCDGGASYKKFRLETGIKYRI